MPVDTLKFDIGIVFLELEINGLVEVNVRSLDCVHVLSGHFKLVEIKVLWEHLHILLIQSLYI